MIAEVSLALVVLVASGLLVNGLLRMRVAQPGFEPKGVFAASVRLTHPAPAFFDGVITHPARHSRGSSMPLASTQLPFSGDDRSMNYTTASDPVSRPRRYPRRPALGGHAALLPRSLGIPLLRGRILEDRDRAGSPDVAVVNQVFAHNEWPVWTP